MLKTTANKKVRKNTKETSCDRGVYSGSKDSDPRVSNLLQNPEQQRCMKNLQTRKVCKKREKRATMAAMRLTGAVATDDTTQFICGLCDKKGDWYNLFDEGERPLGTSDPVHLWFV